MANQEAHELEQYLTCIIILSTFTAQS